MSSLARDRLLCLLLVVAGLGLRLPDLSAPRASPDEGSYLSSARLDAVDREGGPGRWLAQDARWAREMARDYTRAKDKTSYPHSYREQWAMRWFRRLGASCFTAVRLGSALLGALLPLALYGAARRMRTGSAAALLAAAVGALAPVFVWYSRTGWGQIGCTFFYVVHLGLAYRLFDPEAAHGRRALVGLGLGLAATSLLAYGWHEMIVVHVGWTALAAVLAALWTPDGVRWKGALRRLVASPRTWTYVAAAVPAAVLLLGLAFLNPWAGDIWLNPARDAIDRWTRYRLAARFLFVETRVQEQITWPVLALALVGLVDAFRRRGFLCAYLLLALAGGVLPFYLAYNLPHLVRVYLPALTVVALLAGLGFGALLDLARGRAARAALVAVALFVCAMLGLVSEQTLFGAHDAPLVLRRFDLTELRVDLRSHPMRPILAELDRALEPGEAVGVYVAFEARYRLLDHGLRARMLSTGPDGRLAEPREGWPRFVVAVSRDFEGMLNANYGAEAPYALVVRDAADRIGLYRQRGS
jgi:hypothetical protein